MTIYGDALAEAMIQKSIGECEKRISFAATYTLSGNFLVYLRHTLIFSGESNAMCAIQAPASDEMPFWFASTKS